MMTDGRALYRALGFLIRKTGGNDSASCRYYSHFRKDEAV
jgi:hypothetical protein